MPTYREIEDFLYLKQTWEKALNDKIIFDFTSEIDGMLICKDVHARFHNYRQTIRTNRLNPNYSKEWERIQRCELVVISRTSFYLGPKPPSRIYFTMRMYRKKLDKIIPTFVKV